MEDCCVESNLFRALLPYMIFHTFKSYLLTNI